MNQSINETTQYYLNYLISKYAACDRFCASQEESCVCSYSSITNSCAVPEQVIHKSVYNKIEMSEV